MQLGPAPARGAAAVSSYGGEATLKLPGTIVLVTLFFVSFVLYYYINWKYLSELWLLQEQEPHVNSDRGDGTDRPARRLRSAVPVFKPRIGLEIMLAGSRGWRPRGRCRPGREADPRAGRVDLRRGELGWRPHH